MKEIMRPLGDGLARRKSSWLSREEIGLWRINLGLLKKKTEVHQSWNDVHMHKNVLEEFGWKSLNVILVRLTVACRKM